MLKKKKNNEKFPCKKNKEMRHEERRQTRIKITELNVK